MSSIAEVVPLTSRQGVSDVLNSVRASRFETWERMLGIWASVLREPNAGAPGLLRAHWVGMRPWAYYFQVKKEPPIRRAVTDVEIEGVHWSVDSSSIDFGRSYHLDRWTERVHQCFLPQVYPLAQGLEPYRLCYRALLNDREDVKAALIAELEDYIFGRVDDIDNGGNPRIREATTCLWARQLVSHFESGQGLTSAFSNGRDPKELIRSVYNPRHAKRYMNDTDPWAEVAVAAGHSNLGTGPLAVSETTACDGANPSIQFAARKQSLSPGVLSEEFSI